MARLGMWLVEGRLYIRKNEWQTCSPPTHPGLLNMNCKYILLVSTTETWSNSCKVTSRLFNRLNSFKTLSAQRISSSSFTVDPVKLHGTGTPVNKDHPKLRFTWFVSQDTTMSIESMIGWVAEMIALAVNLPEGLGFISFRPLTEKK